MTTQQKYYKASDVAIELGYSPLPWRVVDFAHKSGSEISAINIDCYVPRSGGTGMTVAELFYYKSWQDSNVPRSVVEANAKLIVEAVNQHAALVEQRERLTAALQQIAAFDDAGANLILRKQGDYSGFDEPGAVQTAREVLAAIGSEIEQ